ncbi:hypothetical protein ACVD1N_21920 [Vibrio parahaemolyticus]|uniref:DUF4231 domain-containing protein n=2 Tax=Vibrio vulnificus TaxID=672 RepID=A0AAN1UBV1_VIBVL|nr:MULTISPECIES: hypothetical protein [Vibrio]AXX59725.1 hypothetical protein FORC53_1386 [Vibrio vulnificus]EJA7356674.1 hypothetical protein [Vibrio parahaemolyticus]EKH9203393.1 hypothetical protein [Vibrio parahaemolyticus]ELK8590563.1 hypothetical protein [Vibrio vulnificus]MBE4445206.1 hypothetical protein [Vibrio parahaemolyticus]
MEKYDIEGLICRIEKERKCIWRWARFWTGCYHIAIYGAAILSALAALMLEIDGLLSFEVNNLPSIFAALAALLTTVSGLGGFQRKWQTCRKTNKALSDLRVDAKYGNAEALEVCERYKVIWSNHETGISGSE